MGCFRCVSQCVSAALLLLAGVAFTGTVPATLAENWILLEVALATVAFFFALGLCTMRYYGGILPFKADAGEGMKQPVPYTIYQKEYFPVTSQYFLRYTETILIPITR